MLNEEEGRGGGAANDDLTIVMITDLGCEKHLTFNTSCWNRNVRTRDNDVCGTVTVYAEGILGLDNGHSFGIAE
jgi:hypothetical protein